MKHKKVPPPKAPSRPPTVVVPAATGKDRQPFWKHHLYFALLFLALLVTGFTQYKDYGLSWDETLTRADNGLVNYDYIVHDNYDSLAANREKYHGPAIEIGLVFLEKGMGLTDSRDIFFMRHLVTFLVFALGIFFFYLLCLQAFGSTTTAVIGCACLVLSPRIFADAFYNSKDLVFLSVFIIAMYTAVRFLERKSVASAIGHALACAILVDIRILGIMIPAISLLAAAWDLYQADASDRKRQLISTGGYLVFLVGLIILFWPVLWRSPLHNFVEAWKEMSSYPWKGTVLYTGKFFPAPELPWDYIPRWLLMTTPLLYIALFMAGLLILLGSLWRQSTNTRTKRIYLFFLYCFFAPLLATIFLGSVVYDGWRHLFFIYPAFLFIGLIAFHKILTLLQSKPVLQKGCVGLMLLLLGSTAVVMVELHPYENVYFNKLAGSSMREIKKKYEMDYWGLSYRRGLEYIVENDTASVIKVIAANYPGKTNALMLSPEQRSRLVFLNTSNGADYLISNFRFHPDNYEIGTEIFSIKAGNAKILIVNSLKKAR